VIPGWVRPRAAAQYAGVGRRILYGWLRDGLPHSRLPSGRILIRLADVDLYLRRFQVRDTADVSGIVEDMLRGVQ
jgi:predicted site-specific integrase-resolvase